MHKKSNGVLKSQLVVLSVIILSLLILVFPLTSQGLPISFLSLFMSEEKQAELEEISLEEISNTHQLDLVNSQYNLPNISLTQDLVPVSEELNGGYHIFLRKSVGGAVEKLITTTQRKVGGQFIISSGYRSSTQQDILYNEAEDKSFVQKANHSEHETGYAADIAVLNVEDVANSPQSKYLQKNSWKFGLVLRYPKGKETITRISNEPLHFRYVGEIHAFYMTKHGMVLEEYIDYLKHIKGYIQAINKDKTYHVSYQTPKNGKIKVPIKGNYEVSSDNTGGYIVTSWEEKSDL